MKSVNLTKDSKLGYLPLGAIARRVIGKSGFYWMGVYIVEVYIPQVKVGVSGGKSSCLQLRRRRRKRSVHRAGIRSSRVGRSTGSGDGIRGRQPRVPARSRPGASKQFSARRRFVDWVDRKVGRICDVLFLTSSIRSLLLWEAVDFSPWRVPWPMVHRMVRRLGQQGVWADVMLTKKGKALRMRDALLRRLIRIKGRAPPAGYVEKGLAVRLRTWRSGGLLRPDGRPVQEEDSVLVYEPRGRPVLCRSCGNWGFLPQAESWSNLPFGRPPPGFCDNCVRDVADRTPRRTPQRRHRPRRGG